MKNKDIYQDFPIFCSVGAYTELAAFTLLTPVVSTSPVPSLMA